MVRMFGQDTNLQIMVITRDAFNKDTNIIHNVHDKMGDKPIELSKRQNLLLSSTNLKRWAGRQLHGDYLN